MGVSERETESQAEAATPAAVGVGETLRRARAARGLTIEQIATELRIEAPLLRALEDERFDAIGPPVFAKGYLKHYSQLLGLDHADLLGRYQLLAGNQEVAIQPSRTIKLHNERQVTLWVVAALALAAVAAVLYFWWGGETLILVGGGLGAAAARDAPPSTEPARGRRD